jgi:hypothetical protein
MGSMRAEINKCRGLSGSEENEKRRKEEKETKGKGRGWNSHYVSYLQV